MKYNYYDTEIIKDLVIQGLDKLVEYSENEKQYMDLVEKQFSFYGSKINWEKTINHVGASYNDETLISEASAFVNKLRETVLVREEKVIYIGDGLTSLVYTFDLSNLPKMLPILLSIPQHHYFLPVDCTWCICIAIENSFDFGISGHDDKVNL